jgi:hypothetical protein
LHFRIKPDFSEEEKAEHTRIATKFTKKSFQRRNMLDHDLTNKIWLQQEAIRALPNALQAHALTIDESAAPHRTLPFWDTPPIRDFDIRKYATSAQAKVEN